MYSYTQCVKVRHWSVFALRCADCVIIALADPKQPARTQLVLDYHHRHNNGPQHNTTAALLPIAHLRSPAEHGTPANRCETTNSSQRSHGNKLHFELHEK